MTADMYLLIAGLIFVVSVTVAILIAWSVGRPRKTAKRVKSRAKCPVCKGPSVMRPCPVFVSQDLQTAAICGYCNRVGGGR